jgi:chromosomal replication initiation ATPase DnaA
MTKLKYVYEKTNRSGDKVYVSNVEVCDRAVYCGTFPYTEKGAIAAHKAAVRARSEYKYSRAVLNLCNGIKSGNVSKRDLYTLSVVLKDYLNKGNQKVSIEKVEDVVCAHFRKTKDELHSFTRKNDISIPRSIAMFLMYKYGNTLEAIGAHFGKHHTTIQHHYHTIYGRVKVEDRFNLIVSTIEKKLHE